MATQILMHDLDPTGINPDNLVENEIVKVTDNRGNGHDIIVPAYGYFFAESVVLKIDGVDIPKSQYSFTEYFHKASLKYGKQICGSILVDLTGLKGEYDLSYQALGGDTSRSASNLLAVYYEKLDIDPINWENLRDRPMQYRPRPGHQHNQSEIFDLGRILSYLENIRDALVTLEFPEYNSLMNYINEMLAKIETESIAYLNATMPQLIDKFKAQFTKEYFGLDNLVNIAMCGDLEAYRAGKETYKFTDIAVNKYLTLSSLVMFKEAIYQGIVDKFSTNIGVSDQRFVTPTTKSLLDLPIGGNGSYIGQELALANRIAFSPDIYPDGTIDKKYLTTVKITTNNERVVIPHFAPKQRGTVVLGYDHTRDGIWIGNNADNSPDTPFTWNQFITDGRLDPIVSIMRMHIVDYGNPHQVTKEQIKLGLVENLPVVTKELILALQSDRSYITMDTLMYIMRSHFMQNAWHVKLEEGHKYQFLLDNCQVVFSPCGTCGCDPAVEEVVEPVPEPEPEPTVEISYVCRRTETWERYTDPYADPEQHELSIEYKARQEGRGYDPTNSYDSYYGQDALWKITTTDGVVTSDVLVEEESIRCIWNDVCCREDGFRPNPDSGIGEETGPLKQIIFTSTDLTDFNQFTWVTIISGNTPWCLITVS